MPLRVRLPSRQRHTWRLEGVVHPGGAVRCWIERDFLRVGKRSSARPAYQSQSIRLQNPLNLAARMHRPGPGGIQLHVSLPVLERLTRLTNLLERQREIVVGIRVGWSEL